jgi:hypothetical protein
VHLSAKLALGGHTSCDPTCQLGLTPTEKKPTTVKVESKVWFANERTYISYLSMGLLLSTIATSLLYGGRDSASRWFAFAYALM